jgi:hypothetical protein
VPGHLSCVGLSVANQDDFGRLVQSAPESAHEIATTKRSRHVQWIDPSGASICLHLDRRGRLECVTPFFVAPEGLARWRVRTSAASRDPDCRHCSGADCEVLDANGEMVARATVQWAIFAPYEQWLAEKRTYDLEVVAFAARATFCDSSAAFEAAQADWWGDAKGPEGKPLRFAEVSFVGEGMFGTDKQGTGERAMAVLAGQVETATVRRPERGSTFHHVRVATLPGTIDVVADPENVKGAPASGSIAWIHAWLVGRPVEPPPPEPPRRSLWARLRGLA